MLQLTPARTWDTPDIGTDPKATEDAGRRVPRHLERANVTRGWWRLDGVGYLDRAQRAVYPMAAAGGRPKALTDREGMILVLRSARVDGQFLESDLAVVDRDGRARPAGVRMLTDFFWAADGNAHADRFGVTGVSGGGYLSGWLMDDTHRFRTAVPEHGVYKMFSMWGSRTHAGR